MHAQQLPFMIFSNPLNARWLVSVKDSSHSKTRTGEEASHSSVVGDLIYWSEVGHLLIEFYSKNTFPD